VAACRGRLDVPAQTFSDRVAKPAGGSRLAVNHEGPTRRHREVFEPAQQCVPIGMGRQRGDRMNAGTRCVFPAEEANTFLPIDQASAQRARGPGSDDHDGAFEASEVVAQVMLDATGVAHAAGATMIPPPLIWLSAIDSSTLFVKRKLNPSGGELRSVSTSRVCASRNSG